MEDIYYIRIWEQALPKIKERLKEENPRFDIDGLFNSFDAYLYSISSNKALIACANIVSYSIIQEHNLIFSTCLSDITNQSVYVEPIFENVLRSEKRNSSFKTLNTFNHLNRNYTFSNFVTGKSNMQAHTSALAIANNPGKFYNPLFIYGKPGIGKSHILNAIGNYVTDNFKNFNCLLINSSDFIDLVVKYSKESKLDELKQLLFKLDCFLLDDIQFIAGKEKTHEIFFNVFNELVANQKQIVVTSDRTPNDIKGLEERLISRFNSGLTVCIEPPEYETSLNILKQKIDINTQLKDHITDDVLDYIVKNHSQDVRSLEGALNRLLFFSINISGVNEITMKECLETFKNEIPENKGEITTSKIIRCTCDYYGLTKQQLVSKSRTSNINTARQIAMYLCRQLIDIPFDSIGKDFGGRDHSTVMNACTKIEKLIKEDSMYLKAVNDIKSKVRPDL